MGRADAAEDSGAAPLSVGAAPASGAWSRAWPAAWPLLLWLVIAGIDLAVYRDALSGPFVSDDVGYIVSSPYTRDLRPESIAAILDPTNPAHLFTANYAPVHLLLTAIERQIFAGEVVGYHLVNVLVHALNSVLLVVLLRRSRIPAGIAVFGGLFFAVHPANVEAVAWISQLKTNAALAFSLGALLALERRPVSATALFVLAIGTKASALFALPTALAFAWTRGAADGASPRWAWIGGWAALAGLYAVPQFGFFGAVGGAEAGVYANGFEQLRSIAAYASRYFLMAVSGIGVSAFQEPPPARSLFDPRWLGGLVLTAAIVWRMLVAARARSEELAWWVAAAAAFGPISQVFPFLIPVADRYLYFVLPGLIGAAAFLALDVRRRLGPRPWLAGLAVVLGMGVLVSFATTSAARAKLWTNETLLLLDAARSFPEGGTAAFLQGREAAQRRDAPAAVAALRRAADLGVDQFAMIANDPGLAPIRGTPEFQQLVRDLAARSLARFALREDPTAPELRQAAHAHLARNELAAAQALLERALESGGPFEAVVRRDLAAVRARAAQEQRHGGDASPGGEGHRPEKP